ncbi:MAG: methyl-accepting chemotaxis protein [Treponema sp.]|jgi:methyl-accepting chemotaxis protein|nr:methyl-accepting chemotaxis protein [Treponema sp.]
MEEINKTAASASIKRKFLVFSVSFFLVIFAGGSIAFILSMRQIVRSNTGKELRQTVEIQRIQLEASVNGEIAIALKMADSPLIKRYFMNPEDPQLEAEAFAEIAGYRRAFAANSVFWVNDKDKKFYSDDTYAYTVDPADPGSYWYLMTLNETEKYNFNINYNDQLKKTNLWINAPVFENRRPIGILGTGIDLSAFIDSIYKKYSDRAELYFFNASGEITGAKDTSLVASKTTIDKKLGGTGSKILDTMRQLSPNDARFFSTPDGGVAVGTVPALGWYVTAVLPLTLGDYLQTIMTGIFLAMIVVIAVIFIVIGIFIFRLLNPLNIMVAALDHISMDWDLTRRLEIHQNDEIGTLANFFNMTFEKMLELLKDIKQKTFALSDTGDELSANMSGASAAIDNINANIQNMRGKILTQADDVSSASSSMDRIIKGLEKLNNHIAIQADSVAQSSSAIEEMLANVHSVTETLIRNTTNISSLAESSETGRADLQKVSADIQEIAQESEGLLQINSVMQNIASQTNLLSMNAAIEAAHAGESGKGFAVVADEIRKLAENSGEQSKTISIVLKKIKASIDTITKSTGVVLDRFETIEQEVKTVSNQETQIRNAMEEQEIGSRHILEAITQLNSVTELVQSASAEMAAEGNEALKQSGGLKRITGEVAEGMDEMTQSADQIDSTVTRVIAMGRENKQNISTLSAGIARFKVE